MVKKTLSLLIFFSFSASAQKFDWISHSNQQTANTVTPVAVDPLGNVYTMIWTDQSGTVIGHDTFPGLTFSLYGVLIAKFDSSGNFIWGKMINTDFSGLLGEKIAVDDAGSVYATLEIHQYATIHMADTIFSPSPAGETGVIVKFDSSGHFKKFISFKKSAAPTIACLGTDLYIGYHSTIAKLDSAFNFIWSITDSTSQIVFDSMGYSRADIFVQTNGELITSAFKVHNYSMNVPFGTDTLRFIPFLYYQTAIVKLDTSGQIIWTKTLSLNTATPCVPGAVCLDHAGNAYLGVYRMNSQNVFAQDTLIAPYATLTTYGYYGAVLKWNSSGVPVRGLELIPWYFPAASGGIIPLNDLNVNAQNELLISGYFPGNGALGIGRDTFITALDNFYLIKLDSSGLFKWYKTTEGYSYADGIAIRNGNQYILAGSTMDIHPFHFGCLEYTPQTPTNFVTLISEEQEPVPVASFTFAMVNDTTFMFTDQSTNATSWFWDFGDGDTSSLQNPTHSFSSTGNLHVTLYAYHGGCSSSGTIQIISVGLNKINSSQLFSVYPNPTTGTIRIKSGMKIQNGNIKIYNALGVPVLFECDNAVSNSLEKEIRLNNASPGIYLIRIGNGEKYYTEKFIVE